MASKAPKGAIPFRQLDERNVPCEVALLCWNPTMDLVALATQEGGVMLYRLSWQRVWALPARPPPALVSALAWRPDGRMLAVGYTSGLVLLYEVEEPELTHTLEVSGAVTSLFWTAKSPSPGGATGDPTPTDFYTDLSSQYLPKLPPLGKSFRDDDEDEENIEDKKRLKTQTQLNILIVGTAQSKVLFFSFGIFPSGELDLKEPSSPHPVRICSAVLSEDFGQLTVVSESKLDGDAVRYAVTSYEIPLLQWKYREILVLAKKYGQITSLLSYLAATIKAISEAWEDVLLEIDSKLTFYAQEKAKLPSSGTVSDDFLELLMFGTPSDSLERFLLQDLTEKGLKKLGHSIELSYSNIQKLVLKHLQSVAQCLFYHMSDIKGMACWQIRFSALSLSERAAQDATLAIASFLMKSVEIQQVIDNSMKNFKAFFRWLYTVILRLTDEPVPLEIIKVNQQDLDFVADFLKDSFSTEWDGKSPSTFNLEKVGQYLKNENLTLPPEVLKNPWVVFLEEHPQLKESGVLFPHYPEKSLIQQHVELKRAVEHAFREPNTALSEYIKKKQEHVLFTAAQPSEMRVTHVSAQQTGGYMYTAFTTEPLPSSRIYLLRESLLSQPSMQAVAIIFGEIPDATIELRESPTSPECAAVRHSVLDAQFYHEETLSLLLVEDGGGAPVLAQLPLKVVCHHLKTVVSDSQPLVDAPLTVLDAGLLVSSRRLETMKASRLAVSGTRKVACILFSNLSRVRLFEMDAEDEDDEEEPATDEDTANESQLLDDFLPASTSSAGFASM